MARTKAEESEFARRLAETTPEVTELRDALRRTQNELAKAKNKRRGLEDVVYAAARDAALTLGTPPPVPAPKRDRRSAKPEVAFLHTTDWQVGKETRSYSTEIARERISVEMMDKVELITDIQRSHHPIRECHIGFGGDMIEGLTIFPGQGYEVDSTVIQQLFAASDIEERVIRRALAMFEVVHVYEEYGNHGRMGRRGELPGRDNFDLISYKITKGRMEAEIAKGRVVWHDIVDFYNIIRIGNYEAMLAHGDEIKSFGGNLPSFGIRRKVTAWAAGAMSDNFMDVYLGHYHIADVIQLPNGYRVFITPSPESDNAYAKEFVASAGVPGQRLHFVEPDRGRVTSEHVIWLDKNWIQAGPSYPRDAA